MGNNLRNLRIQNGKSQEDIAELLQKSQTTISKYEGGSPMSGPMSRFSTN